MDPQPTNQPKCSLCTVLIPNVESNATNLKCEECLKISIPSGFPFKMVNEEKKYECPFCLMLMKNATELTACFHLSCKECLAFYESVQQRKSIG